MGSRGRRIALSVRINPYCHPVIRSKFQSSVSRRRKGEEEEREEKEEESQNVRGKIFSKMNADELQDSFPISLNKPSHMVLICY